MSIILLIITLIEMCLFGHKVMDERKEIEEFPKTVNLILSNLQLENNMDDHSM